MHPVGGPGGVVGALVLVAGTALGDDYRLVVQAGQVHHLLDVQQGVAVGAHAVKFIPLGVAAVVPAVVVQGGPHPVHILVAGVVDVHIHLVGAAVVGGEDHGRPGGLAAGDVHHVLIGGDEVRWLGLIAPHVHLAADADEDGAA